MHVAERREPPVGAQVLEAEKVVHLPDLLLPDNRIRDALQRGEVQCPCSSEPPFVRGTPRLLGVRQVRIDNHRVSPDHVQGAVSQHALEG